MKVWMITGISRVQEFKLPSHREEAQFGQALGGIVHVVTKAGTNNDHVTRSLYLLCFHSSAASRVV